MPPQNQTSACTYKIRALRKDAVCSDTPEQTIHMRIPRCGLSRAEDSNSDKLVPGHPME